MNSISFFTNNPAFKLNGTTSVSSWGSAVTITLLLIISLSLCSSIIQSMWAPIWNLYSQYSQIQGTHYSITPFQIALRFPPNANTSKILLELSGTPVSPVSCEREQLHTLCFQIKGSNFSSPVVYHLPVLSTPVSVLITTTNYNKDYVREQKTTEILLNPNQSLQISLKKYLILVDDSLFQYQPYTQISGISNITHSLSLSLTLNPSLQFQSQKQMTVLMFKRQKVTLVFGKIIICFQFLLFITSILLITPYHQMKYKYQVARQTIKDPILNIYKLNTLRLILLTLYHSLNPHLKNYLRCLFPTEIMYISLIIIPEFDERLSIDKLNIEHSEESVELYQIVKSSNINREGFRLMIDNYLDDEEEDQGEIEARLGLVDRQLERVRGRGGIDYWTYLHHFDLSGKIIQFQSSPLEENPKIQSTTSLQEPHRAKPPSKSMWLNGVVVVCLILLFLSFFVSDIIEYIKSSRSIETYTTINHQLSYRLRQLSVVGSSSYQIRSQVQRNGIYQREGDVKCESSSVCLIGGLLESSLGSSQVLKVFINSSSSVQVSFESQQLLTYDITNSTYSISVWNESISLSLPLIELKTGAQSQLSLSSPSTITRSPSTSHNIELTLSLDPLVSVRKITYNGYYTIIKNSWSVLRFILITMIFQLVINPIRKKISTTSFVKKHQESDNENILDIGAILNFINTKISKNRQGVIPEDTTNPSHSESAHSE